MATVPLGGGFDIVGLVGVEPLHATVAATAAIARRRERYLIPLKVSMAEGEASAPVPPLTLKIILKGSSSEARMLLTQ